MTDSPHLSRLFRILGVALLFGLVFWVIDGLINYYYFRSYLRFMLFQSPQSLLDTLLLHISSYALFVRISFLFACLIGGVLTYSFFDREQRAKQELQNSEERYRLLFEMSPESITLIGLDGTILDCNSQTLEISGLAREDVVGRPFDTLVTLLPENLPHYLTLFMEIKDQGEINPVELRTVHPDHTERWVEAFPALLKKDGVPFAIQVISRDITERKQIETTLHQRQREMSCLLETSRDLSCVLDLNQLLEIIAQRALSLLEAQECIIMRLENDGTTLTPILVVGANCAAGMTFTIKVGQGITGRSVADNQPMLVNYVQNDPRGVPVPGTTNYNVEEHLMTVPLVFRDQVRGVMAVTREGPPPFTQENLNLCMGIAQQATIAIQNAQLFQHMEAHSESLEQAVKAHTHELQQTKERVETILRNSPDAILLLGPDGVIENTNRTFYDMFGYSLSEVRQNLSSMLVGQDGIGPFDAMLRAALEQGQAGRVEIKAVHKNGRLFDADAAFAPVAEGDQVSGLVCSIRDISALKEVERMKDEFVSNVTHELRTPVTSIKLYHYLMEREPNRLNTYMDRLKRETGRLEHIIDDLLHLSRLDQGRIILKLTPVDLNVLAQHYAVDRSLLAQDRGLMLVFVEQPDLPPVQADKGLIGQALSVLLTNALNYTPKGGRVTIHTQVRNNAERLWAGISVSDTGPGILPGDQVHLFERFFRGQVGVNSGTPGTGLGLALFKEIVDRHHGEIEVLSDGIPGEGVTFTMWLPA